MLSFRRGSYFVPIIFIKINDEVISSLPRTVTAATQLERDQSKSTHI